MKTIFIHRFDSFERILNAFYSDFPFFFVLLMTQMDSSSIEKGNFPYTFSSGPVVLQRNNIDCPMAISFWAKLILVGSFEPD